MTAPHTKDFVLSLGLLEKLVITLFINFTGHRTHYPPHDTFCSYRSANQGSFHDFLVLYLLSDCCFKSGISASVPNFFNAWTFYQHIPKPDKPESPEWLNHPCDPAVCLKHASHSRWDRSLTMASHQCVLLARNKGLPNMQTPKESLFYYKAKRLHRSSGGRRTFWFPQCFPDRIPPISDHSDELVRKIQEKMHSIPFISPGSSSPTLPLLYLLLLVTPRIATVFECFQLIRLQRQHG